VAHWSYRDADTSSGRHADGVLGAFLACAAALSLAATRRGDGIGGGLCVAAGGAVTLKHALVLFNFASTSNANIYGTVTYS